MIEYYLHITLEESTNGQLMCHTSWEDEYGCQWDIIKNITPEED